MNHTKTSKEKDLVAGKGNDADKPHGMPLTLASGGYGGDPCTGTEAEEAGECPDEERDSSSD